MNILIYSKFSTYGDNRIGGAETSLRLIAENLITHGMRVTYLTTNTNPATWLEQKIINGVNVILYPQIAKSRLLRKFNRWLGKDLEKKLLHYFLKRSIKKHRIDLVYTYYDLSALEILIQLRPQTPFKIVMRMAGLKWYEESMKDPALKERYEAVFNQVDSINYNTPGLKGLCYRLANDLTFNLAPKDEFVADIGAFAPDIAPAERHAPQHHLRLVVATRFSNYQKRHDIFIQALALLKRRIPLRVLLIGTGPAQAKLEELIDQHQLRDSVKIQSFLPQQKLWKELLQHDVLCHPCDYEGLSKIIAESMLLNLPVLASNVPPLTDYIVDGNTGYLASNTPEAWAQRIEYIFMNRHELPQIAARAKEYAERNFEPHRNIHSYIKKFLCLNNGLS